MTPAKTPPPHFIVFVPGYMGSQLRDGRTGEILWIDVPAMLKRGLNLPKAIEDLFTRLKYPNPDIEPAGIVDDVLFLPPFFKQEQYGRMLEYLAEIGYQIDPPASKASKKPSVYTFAYDWRQDNRISARELGEAIAVWEKRHPGAKAWLIGHSNGGIVSRWYIEKEGGKDHVERLFLMGSPWDGAPKSMQVMMEGMQVMFLRLFNRLVDIPTLTRELVTTFPSYYQLIPHTNPFLRDVSNEVVNPFEQFGWLEDDEKRKLALDGLKFNQELGRNLSVESYCFVGNRLPTTTGGMVHMDAVGTWKRIEWDRTEAGDGTVPERSAINTNAREVLPYHVGHGDIYIHPDVLEKLEWELARKYKGGVLATQLVGQYHIEFNPEGDVFSPGETIPVWATVTNLKKNTAVLDAKVRARLVWRKALPGQTEIEPPDLPEVELKFNPKKGLRFLGSLVAPTTQGYYAVQGEVILPRRKKPVLLDELILVEEEPPLEEMASSEEESLPPSPGGGEPPFEGGPGSGQPVLPTTGGGPADEQPETSLSGGGTADWFGESFSFQPPPLGEASEAAAAEGAPANAQFIKPEILEQLSDRHLEKEALQPGQAYVLAFSIDSEQTPWSMPLDRERIFQPEEQEVELEVLVTSSDFAVYTQQPQKLRLPRQGRSKNKARFDFEPLQAGQGIIQAFFLKENNFIQGMKLTLNVGNNETQTIVASELTNRLPAGALPVEPRDLSLVIKDVPGGFNLTLIGPVAAEATLKITLQDLDRLISGLRKTLKEEIVYFYNDEGSLVYQNQVHIDPQVAEQALARLAKAGYRMFFRLFFEGGDANTRLLGSYLIELSRQSTLKIQIVSDKFMLPWGVLYLAERFDPSDIQWENFLGFKHIIEHVPYQTSLVVSDNRISSLPLGVNLNIDLSLDTDFEANWSASQKTYWENLPGVEKKIHTTIGELKETLSDVQVADQLLYYFGHAKAEYGEPDSSPWLKMMDDYLMLEDLKFDAPTSQKLDGAPLIFLNACESGDLSPIYYGGFMQYFIERGARGMIGTECEIPGVFASEWARRFFNQFLSGKKTVGQVFLDLRREFLLEENNLLGLLYALYCDSDTRLAPGLKIQEG